MTRARVSAGEAMKVTVLCMTAKPETKRPAKSINTNDRGGQAERPIAIRVRRNRAEA